MDIFKKIIYFLFAPIMFLLVAFVVLVYGKDKDTEGWYQLQWRKGGFFRMIFLILLAPIIFTPVYILRFTHKPWDDLLD